MRGPDLQVGDPAEMAGGPVMILDRRETRRMGVEYKVIRTRPEPVGYHPDGSIMTSTGYPFWTQAWLVRPVA